MHISEGVLSTPVLCGGMVIATVSLLYSLKKLPWQRLMTVGVVSSAFFVASLIHVPIGLVSIHLIMNGLMGALLGWAALPAIAVALFLQAILFQYGGFFVLGVNICVLGLPAVIAGAICAPFFLKQSAKSPGCFNKVYLTRVNLFAAFCCGALSVALSAVFFAIALALSGDEFIFSAGTVLLAHVPIMIIEGILTMLIVNFLAKVFPKSLISNAI